MYNTFYNEEINDTKQVTRERFAYAQSRDRFWMLRVLNNFFNKNLVLLAF